MNESRQPIVLISGLPRSGTTWMVHSLNLHPKVLAFGETHFFSKRWVRTRRNGRYTSAGLRSLWSKLERCPFWASVPLKSDLDTERGWLLGTSRDDIPDALRAARRMAGPDPTAAEVLDSIGRSFCEREGKSFWIEKTAVEGKQAHKIARRFPDARLLLTMRDPVGFFRSYKYQGVQLSDARRLFHQRRYHPLLAALIWRLSVRSALKAQAEFPDRVSVMFLRDEASMRVALDQACRAVGVESDDAMYELIGARVNSSELGTRERDLDAQDVAWIRLLCRSGDSRFSSSEDLDGFSLVALLKSLAGLIPWFCRNFLHRS